MAAAKLGNSWPENLDVLGKLQAGKLSGELAR
jgi:hypothetical protein